MAKKLDIAARLEELDHDPVASLVTIAKAAEASNSKVLAAKINLELVGYLTPKLKAVEHSIEPDTRDFLDRQQRLARIRELAAKTGALLGENGLPVLEGELKHIPDPE